MTILDTFTIYDYCNKPYKGILYIDNNYASNLCFKYANCKTSALAFTNSKYRDGTLAKNNPHIVVYIREHYPELFI